jgi:hypothetical protein
MPGTIMRRNERFNIDCDAESLESLAKICADRRNRRLLRRLGAAWSKAGAPCRSRKRECQPIPRYPAERAERRVRFPRKRGSAVREVNLSAQFRFALLVAGTPQESVAVRTAPSHICRDAFSRTGDKA